MLTGLRPQRRPQDATDQSTSAVNEIFIIGKRNWNTVSQGIVI